MREILFRGFQQDKDRKEKVFVNGEWIKGRWVYGYYVKAKYHWHKYGIHEDWIITNAFQNGGYFNVCQRYSVITETVGQYTGLKDKNGKKIFEWDVVECYDKNIDDNFIAIVKFGNPNGFYNWGYQLKPITKTDFNCDILCWAEMEETGAYIEIIGNVFENPELLKGGEE